VYYLSLVAPAGEQAPNYLLPAFLLFVALPQFDDRLLLRVLLLFFLSALGREMKTYLTIED
jgi:hypothetical protein